MFKYKAVILVLLAALFTPVQSYCQQAINDQQINTIAGKVTYVDPAGAVIKVKTNFGPMVFYISVESDLFQFTHHMASVDIEKGDPVIVQYERSSIGKNTIIRLVDKRPESS